MKSQNFLIFPKPDSKYFYLLVFIVCSLIRRLIPRAIELGIKDPQEKFSQNELENMNYNKNICYVDLLSNFIADFLAGIIILYNKCQNKDNSNTNITSQGLKEKSKMQKLFYFYLPTLAAIDFTAQLCLFFFSFLIPKNELVRDEAIEEENLYFVVLIDIISRYGFSRFLLKSYFYNHHIVSIVITIIGFIPLTVINITDIMGLNINQYFYLILFIVMTIIYSLEDVLNKICLNQLLLRPYELMFYKAVFQIILVIPLTLYCFLGCNLYTYIVENISLLRTFYRVSFIISNIFRTWSLITIIELLNPNHLSVLKSSEFIVLFIFISTFHECFEGDENKKKDKTLFYIFGLITCFISFIGSAIHNEIIIINKWGLLECTLYYKTELKETPNLNEDLENEDDRQNDQRIDSFLGDSVDND